MTPETTRGLLFILLCIAIVYGWDEDIVQGINT